MKKNDIIITYGSDAAAMTEALLRVIDLTVLIPDVNASIILKPNLVVPAPAQNGATTHPEISEAIITHLKSRGWHNITVLESAWIGDSTQRGFALHGYTEMTERYDIRLVDCKTDQYVTKRVGQMTMEVSKTLLESDFVINLPVLKGHCQTRVTCALKNMKGCISDRSKRAFHTMGLHHPIAALNSVRAADLVIVDSICGDLDFEEGGNPIETNRMFAARDSVLCDSYASSLIGYESSDVPYIGIAEEMGVGSADLSAMNLIQLNEPTVEVDWRPTGEAFQLARHTDQRDACSACFGNLIHALKRLDEEGSLSALTKTISIGQGFKGISDPDAVGVGICTAKLGSSLMGCPPTAQAMVSFLRTLR
jgi:uncharacterized protein (DUF362 family)